MDELESAQANADKIQGLRDELETLRNLVFATRSSLGGGLLDEDYVMSSATREPQQPEIITARSAPDKHSE